ncbi:MAG: CRISPR system precrRNA processing endoribonuclease RAMP protein Cas6 [Thermodesulfobacteriota bacterium]|nr:CRISPR system precrRNA processing endoribonuclease RAMP protein Cas6 [Thermodesulfobacteriota bacterium]
MVTNLKRAEFIKLEFELRFDESIDVDLATLLRLRRSLRSAAQYALPQSDSVVAEQQSSFGRLFSPALPDDPVALRQFQKGSPAFVLHHDLSQLRLFKRGEYFTLTVFIWGGDHCLLYDFALVIQALGKTGLRHDAGRFELTAIFGEDSSQHRDLLWTHGEALDVVTAPVRDAQWWLDSCAVDCAGVQLQFITPARLIVKQRPLFKPTFAALFPFILRRVTAMLYTHSHLDLDVDIQGLLVLSRQIEEGDNRLQWNDWRELNSDAGNQPIGGVCGTIELGGSALIDLLPYLYLGSLMNLGKNAAYGAGCYRVLQLE